MTPLIPSIQTYSKHSNTPSTTDLPATLKKEKQTSDLSKKTIVRCDEKNITIELKDFSFERLILKWPSFIEEILREVPEDYHTGPYPRLIEKDSKQLDIDVEAIY